MADFNPDVLQVPIQTVEKPTSVTVFGVLNLAVGCYQLIRILPGFYKITVGACNNPEKIIGSEILVLLLCLVGIGLSVWLIVLGIGLLGMKKWSRRGSIMYARIQIVLIAITIGMLVISLSIGWSSLPKDRLGVFLFQIVTGLIGKLAYPVLLLIFMQTARVKQAFSAEGG